MDYCTGTESPTEIKHMERRPTLNQENTFYVFLVSTVIIIFFTKICEEMWKTNQTYKVINQEWTPKPNISEMIVTQILQNLWFYCIQV